MKRFFTCSRTRIFHCGFTIVELLVTVAIIGALLGVLLPAIGHAREKAKHSQSQSNSRQIGIAILAYAAEFADRQPTFINDNISTYGNYSGLGSLVPFQNYLNQNGIEHPWCPWGHTIMPYSGPSWCGWGDLGLVPMNFYGGYLGTFRTPNVLPISTYLNGRFYDPVFYAPKDTAVMDAVEKRFSNHWIPQEDLSSNPHKVKWSSYCMSPAAMFNPVVFSKVNTEEGPKFFTNPWTLPSGFKSPGMSQASYSNLKTHVMEHHWLQGCKRPCHPSVVAAHYDGCGPYIFNAAFNSSPVTLFYDGHVGAVGTVDSMQANQRMVQQTGVSNHGLWSKDTPMGGSYEDGGTGGYFSDLAYDGTSTSFHIMTIDGIKGRDIVSR